MQLLSRGDIPHDGSRRSEDYGKVDQGRLFYGGKTPSPILLLFFGDKIVGDFFKKILF
jgi:hypothetical protein